MDDRFACHPRCSASPAAIGPASTFRCSTRSVRPTSGWKTALGIDDVRARLRTVGWLDPLEDNDLAGGPGTAARVESGRRHPEPFRELSDRERVRAAQPSVFPYPARGSCVRLACCTRWACSPVDRCLADGGARRDRRPARRSVAGTGIGLEPADFHVADRTGRPFGGTAEQHQTVQRRTATAATRRRRRPRDVPRGQGLDGGLSPGVSHQSGTSHPRHRHACSLEIEEHGVGVLHRRALLGADLPQVAGKDPGPEWLEHRRVRWEGLRAWFLPAAGRRRGRTSCTSWPGRRSSRCSRRWTGSRSRAGQQCGSGLPRTGAVVHRRPQGGGPAPPVDMAFGLSPPATPTWPIPTRSYLARLARGTRRRPSRSRRCCGREVARSGSARTGGCAMSRRSGPRGRNRPGRNGPNSRSVGHSGPAALPVVRLRGAGHDHVRPAARPARQGAGRPPGRRGCPEGHTADGRVEIVRSPPDDRSAPG